jgi:hypothetical protein
MAIQEEEGSKEVICNSLDSNSYVGLYVVSRQAPPSNISACGEAKNSVPSHGAFPDIGVVFSKTTKRNRTFDPGFCGS